MNSWLEMVTFSFFGIVGVLAAAVFWLLAKQWMKRRQPHLLLLALSFLAIFFGAGFGILAKALPAFVFGLNQAPWQAAAALFSWLHLVGVALAAVAAYARRRAWLTLPVALCAVVLIWTLSLMKQAGAFGLPDALAKLDWNFFAGLLIVVSSLLLTLAARAYRSKHVAGAGARPDWWLVIAGASGIATGVLIRLSDFAHSQWAMTAAFLVGLIYLTALLLGFAAKWQSAPTDLASPSHLIVGSLVTKSWLTVFLTVCVMMTLLMGFLTSFYRRSLLADRVMSLDSSVGHIADSFAVMERSVLVEVESLVHQGNFLTAMTALNAGESAEYQPVADFRRMSIARVFGSRGQIIWSGFGDAEIGQPMGDSVVAIKASAGFKSAGLESESSLSDQALLFAGVPVIFADGSVGALVAAKEPELPVLSATGSHSVGLFFGDSPVRTFGAADWSTISAWLKTLGDRPSDSRVLSDGGLVAARAAFTTDGRNVGWLVLAESAQAAAADLARAFYAALLLALLLALAAASVMAWLVGRLLKPIGDIGDVLTNIESGQPKNLVAHSTDEVGQLIAIVNRSALAVSTSRVTLQRVMGEMGDFLTNAANEMRTPLSVLRWGIDLLRFGDAGRLSRNQLELMEQLHQITGRLQRLVRNLSDVAMFERGQIKMKMRSTVLEDVAERAAGTLAIRMREKQLDFQLVRPSRRSKTRVMADGERLHQVMLNLLSNAIKYVDAKGRISVTIDSTTRPDFAVVSVEDDGRGIPADQQPRLFSKFFRARNAMSDDAEGAGLGLHVVKRIIELHGGEIWFESVEDAGTTFHFTIPKLPAKK